MAVDEVLEFIVRRGGIGYGRLAPQRRRGAEAVEHRIDLCVQPADEETGDRDDSVDWKTLLNPGLEAGHVGVDDLPVAVDVEQQGDVDVDPLADAPLDGGKSGRSSRDLDLHVGAIDRAPQPGRFLHGSVSLVGQLRRDLERD